MIEIEKRNQNEFVVLVREKEDGPKKFTIRRLLLIEKKVSCDLFPDFFLWYLLRRSFIASRNRSAMEESLTTSELSTRIKMAPGKIRNLVWKKELKENVHYLRPTPRKILFVWSQVQEWLYSKPSMDIEKPNASSRSLINIWSIPRWLLLPHHAIRY